MGSFLARRRPSWSAVVAVIALIVALGGTNAYGAAVNFLLNTGNTSTATTTLDGSAVVGKALQITNTNTGTGATALGLKVAAGHPPFTVNSGTKVANLNADKLDGIDSTAFVRKGIAEMLNVGGGAVVDVTNTGTGNGVRGATADSGASGVYGENTGGGGYGVAGRAGAGGYGVFGDNTGGGYAGYFTGNTYVGGQLTVNGDTAVGGKLTLNGALDCVGCVSASDIDTQFMTGSGKAGGQAVAIPAGQNLWLGNPLLGFLRLIYACPANLASNGTFAFNNDSGSLANVFVESGGANPSYYQMNPGDQVQFPAATTGDSWHIQAQGALGIITIEAASVHRPASNDCHVQAQAVLTK